MCLRGADASTLAPEPSSQSNAHSGWVECVAFSPTEVRIVSGSADRSLKLWGGCHSLAQRARAFSLW